MLSWLLSWLAWLAGWPSYMKSGASKSLRLQGFVKSGALKLDFLRDTFA